MIFKFNLGDIVNVTNGPQQARIVTRGITETVATPHEEPHYNLRVPEGDGNVAVWESELTLAE